MKAFFSTLALSTLLFTASACDRSSSGGDGDGGTGGNSDQGVVVDSDGGTGLGDGGVNADQGGTPVVITLPDGGTYICYTATCQGKLYACGDCMDNDGDGLVDAYDSNCLGPCQNNEAGLFGAIPGQNNAPCKMDCYWDQDTGSGNDSCNWDHRCDPFEAAPPPVSTSPSIGCDYNPNHKVSGASVPNGQNDCTYLRANQSQACTNFCRPLTPNGCDCFGCCENPNKPGTYVYAGSVNASGAGTCDTSPASLNDATKCKACTPVVGCSKPCGRCQLCFGKTTLPPDCYGQPIPDGGTPPGDGGTVGVRDGGAPQECPPGDAPCGLPGQAPCPSGSYCITGCCVPIIL
jgi:hypothetical protein